MKPIYGLFISIGLFVLLCIGAYLIQSNAEGKYKELNIKELNEKVTNKEDFILHIRSSKLEEDQNFNTLFKLTIEEYNVPVYYIEIRDLNNTELTDVINLVSIDRTPTVAFITKGAEITKENRIVGYVNDEETKLEITNKLRRNGYIK